MKMKPNHLSIVKSGKIKTIINKTIFITNIILECENSIIFEVIMHNSGTILDSITWRWFDVKWDTKPTKMRWFIWLIYMISATNCTVN